VGLLTSNVIDRGRSCDYDVAFSDWFSGCVLYIGLVHVKVIDVGWGLFNYVTVTSLPAVIPGASLPSGNINVRYVTALHCSTLHAVLGNQTTV
jgi:hypothetical protein